MAGHDDDWDDDDDEDRPRRRRRRFDDDDYEYDDDDRAIRRVSGRSGPVTAIGIVNIVLGTLGAIGSFCILIGGFFIAGAPAFNRGGPGPGAPPAGMMGLMGGAVVLVGVLAMLFGAAYIFAGIGVLNRRNWARILSLVLGGFTGLGALLGLLGSFRMIANPGQMGAGLGNLSVAGLQLGYVIFMYTILLNARFASEFR
jgi:hypothetical protein